MSQATRIPVPPARLSLALLCGAVIAWLALLLTWGKGASASEVAPLIVQSSPSITQLQSLGELTVMRVQISDVLTASNEDVEGSWLIKGDAQVTVDLRQAKLKEADQARKTLTIILPKLQISLPRVDHERSKTWDVRDKRWTAIFRGNDRKDALRDQAMRIAQELVQKTSQAAATMELAKNSTKLVIGHMYSLIGWAVMIEWEGDTVPTKNPGEHENSDEPSAVPTS